MILDALLQFTGTRMGTATGTAGGGLDTDTPTTGTQVSSQVLDLGVNSGVPTSANGGGARDIGIGDSPMLELSCIVTTAFTGGTSLQVNLQGAPDNGSGLPGSYTTMWSSPVVAEASLVAGQQLANVAVPRTIPGQPLPRFLRLQYVSVGTHGAGAIQSDIVLDRDDQIVGPAGQYSGYPVGLTVAN